MNWSVLTKKQQQMVILTVVLAVAQIGLMAHFLGFTKPAASRGGSAKKELLELQQKIEDARTVLLQERAIHTGLTESVTKLEDLMVHAPTLSDRYAWSYEYVSRCAKLARVELDSLEEVQYLQDNKQKSGDAPYEIMVSTRCGYNNLVEFLWRLEKDNPLLRINEVEVSSIPDQNLSHQVQVKIQWPSSVKIERGTP
jgi:hypothetical protein